MRTLLLCGLCLVLLLASCANLSIPGQPVNVPVKPSAGSPSNIALPAGFTIEIFADIPNARSLEVVEREDRTIIFVGTRQDDKVYAIVDEDSDNLADRTFTLAEGLTMPNGVAYRDGSLYVAEVSRILEFPDILDNLDDPSHDVIFDSLPADTHHGWKYIAFSPDGLLYIPIGAPCNICAPGRPYASITTLNVTSKQHTIIAEGIRNTVGFDWHPQTGELWFTDNGRDWLGDNRPPDELNRLRQPGQHFGYPYCHGTAIEDPEFGDGECAGYAKPEVELGPHVAALGMEFYESSLFPEEYHGKIFIAEHGSWNREDPIGYRVMLVDPATGSYQPFAEGWLQDDGEASGRPVDVEQLPDGSLLVSDDLAGKLYRISYSG